MKLKEEERIDDLQYKGLKIIQNVNWFCFGMDSVLLTEFAKEIKKGSKVIDMGTGTGIIGLLLCEKTQLSEMIGIELQKEVAEMAQRSIILNNLQDKFKIINSNIKDIQLEANKYDAIVTNPPYKKENTGVKNQNEKKLVSRHEKDGTLEDFIKTASKLLKDKGSLYMVHRPERTIEILETLRKNKLEPKNMRFVYPKINKPANLLLIKATKYGQPFLKIMEPLIIYNEDGTYTKEIEQIYENKGEGL